MEVKVYSEPVFGGVSFVLFKGGPGKNYVVKPVDFILSEINEADMIDPTFRLNSHDATEFLQTMADICHERGIRPKSAPILENELSATKSHLEDMRRLVFRGAKK